MKSYRKERERKIRELLDRRLEAAGIVATNSIKEHTHVDQGRLRASITYVRQLQQVIVGTNVEYAVYEEMLEGHSYLVAGLMAAIGEIRRVMGGR